MIEKGTLLKAFSTTLCCLGLGALCALAPAQGPFMKSFFAIASLIFFGGTLLTIPSIKKHPLYWSMLTFWSAMQSLIFFVWIVPHPTIVSLAWAITPLAYTTVVSLIVVTIHKSIALTARQRMLLIMSLFLGGMFLILGDTSAMKSLIVYFIALVVFPVNLFELFHEPSEAGSRLGHNITITLLGSAIAFYLLDSIGTILISVDGFRYVSMYPFFEGLFPAAYPFATATLAYSGVFACIFLLFYLILVVLPRACCTKQTHEDLF